MLLGCLWWWSKNEFLDCCILGCSMAGGEDKMAITTLMVVVIGVLLLCLLGFMISLQLHYKRLASRSTDVSPGVERT